jgi:hypothetical protein
MDAGAAYKRLLHYAKLYLRGTQFSLVCSCKPKDCHGDVLAAAIPYLAEQIRLQVGDRVRHVDERCNAHQWHGKIVWVVDSIMVDVEWQEVMVEGVVLKHPVRGTSYSLPPYPMRYSLDMLEKIQGDPGQADGDDF